MEWWRKSSVKQVLQDNILLCLFRITVLLMFCNGNLVCNCVTRTHVTHTQFCDTCAIVLHIRNCVTHAPDVFRFL